MPLTLFLEKLLYCFDLLAVADEGRQTELLQKLKKQEKGMS